MSSTGREPGEEGLDGFHGTKQAHWDFTVGLKGWWYPCEGYNPAREE